MKDPVIDLIAQLPQATEAEDRARRTQDRCHRVLDRRARRDAVAPLRTWQAWPRALVVLGAIYVAEAVRESLRMPPFPEEHL